MGIAGTPKGKGQARPGTTPKSEKKQQSGTPAKGNVHSKTPDKKMLDSGGTPFKNTPKSLKKASQPGGTPQGNKTPLIKKGLTPKASPAKQILAKSTPKTPATVKSNPSTPQLKKSPKGNPKAGKGNLTSLRQGELKGSKTPQPAKVQKPKLKTPQSAPAAHIKRKKLDEELDEELSDDDFEALLGNMKEKEKSRRAGLLGKEEEEEDSEGDEEDDSEDDDDDDDDIEDDDDSEDDDEDDDDEDDEEEDSDDDDDEDDSEDDDEDDDEESEEDLKLGKSQVQQKNIGKNTPKPLKVVQSEGSQKQKTDQSADKKAAIKRKADDATTSSKPETNESSKRKLFIKNLPNDITVEKVKALSADIVSVQLRMSTKHKSTHRGFAFLEFKNEALAQNNYKLLQTKSFGQTKLFVDFAGQNVTAKKHDSGQLSPGDIDPLKLYVTGFDRQTCEAELKDLFPTSIRVELPRKARKNKPLGFAFVFFETPGATSKARAKMHGRQLRQSTLVVLPGKKATKRKAESSVKDEPQSKKAKNDENGLQKSVMKKAPAKSSSDDEEDDEDMDDDDESDDDSEEEEDSDDDEEEEEEEEDEEEDDSDEDDDGDEEDDDDDDDDDDNDDSE